MFLPKGGKRQAYLLDQLGAVAQQENGIALLCGLSRDVGKNGSLAASCRQYKQGRPLAASVCLPYLVDRVLLVVSERCLLYTSDAADDTR